MIVKDYKDAGGMWRRVLVPDDSTPPDMGIMVSVYLDDALLERGWSRHAIQRLNEELWALGMVTSADFLRADSPKLLRSALLAACLMDVQTMQTVAKEQHHHGKSRQQS